MVPTFLRRTIRIGIVIIIVLVAVIIAGMFTLRPPTLAVPDQGLVLLDVTVINPGRERQPKQALTVKGEKIARISESNAQASAGMNTRRFAGAYVLPGLIDMHVHFAS